MASSFTDKALQFVLTNEGGYVNDPRDTGGETNLGITKAVALEAGYTGEMRDLTVTGAKVIYRKFFWIWDGFDSQRLATKCFDIGVNCGNRRAVRLLQQAMNNMGAGIVSDGNLGPKTLAFANASDEVALLKKLVVELNAHYVNLVAKQPGKRAFLNGWLNRAARLPEAE